MLVAVLAIGFAVTGGILMHRQNLQPWLVSRALWTHAFLAICAIALFAGHLAHVFITKHGRTYLAGMIRGWIPEELAFERHRRWWAAETGGDDPETGRRAPRIRVRRVRMPLPRRAWTPECSKLPFLVRRDRTDRREQQHAGHQRGRRQLQVHAHR